MSTKTTNETPQDTFAELIGHEVYTISGRYVGQVVDVRIDIEAGKATGLAMDEFNPGILPESYSLHGSEGIIVPYRWIHSVSDVIVVNDIFERLDTVSE